MLGYYVLTFNREAESLVRFFENGVQVRGKQEEIQGYRSGAGTGKKERKKWETFANISQSQSWSPVL